MATPKSSTPPSGSKAGIAVGIAIGIVSILLVSLLVYWHVRHRRRRRAGCSPPDIIKPELAGSLVAKDGPYMPYEKPELAGQGRMIAELSDKTVHVEEPMYNELADKRIDRNSNAQEMVHEEKPHRPVPTIQHCSTATSAIMSTARCELASDKTFMELESRKRSDINALKARERELAQEIEMDESLQRLKAEQAALQDRIRLAEMKMREFRVPQ